MREQLRVLWQRKQKVFPGGVGLTGGWSVTFPNEQQEGVAHASGFSPEWMAKAHFLPDSCS